MSILNHALKHLKNTGYQAWSWEIIYSVVSVHPSTHPSALSCLDRFTHGLYFWHNGRPWPWLAWDCRSRSKVKVKWRNSAFWNHILRSFNLCQGHAQRSRSEVKFKMTFFYWCRVVDNGTWPSTAKSPLNHKLGTLGVQNGWAFQNGRAFSSWVLLI